MKIEHDGKMTVAAHRGDSYNYYENTMTAFNMAIDAGADMIETDVRLTSDGVTVLIHDGTFERTTDSVGLVKEKNYEDLLKINAGDKNNIERIPTLESVIKLASEKSIMLNIEIKEYFSEENKDRSIKCIEDVIGLVEKYEMAEKVVINSFDACVLEYVYKKYGNKYMLHGFYPYSLMDNVSINPDEYLYCACIFDTLNKELYDYLIEKGIELWIGAGVTQEEKFKIALEYGAKLVTTNNPADTLSKLKKLRAR